ncbi:hypothetical protein AAFF_G00323130 [Aldrovandia affinis]|uniref:Uncharacterized protein n=1 Tax=Aldrovandia affinis TaxID=143900 RepID=A0AAD7SNL6_9TELE|nr:hypothetical protein AAFF_G00323130 [Aldrovandia affinis]
MSRHRRLFLIEDGFLGQRRWGAGVLPSRGLFPLCCTERRVALPCVEPQVCGQGPPALSSLAAASGEPPPTRLDLSPLSGVEVQQYLQCWALQGECQVCRRHALAPAAVTSS